MALAARPARKEARSRNPRKRVADPWIVPGTRRNPKAWVTPMNAIRVKNRAMLPTDWREDTLRQSNAKRSALKLALVPERQERGPSGLEGPRRVIGVGFAVGPYKTPTWGYRNQVWIGWMTGFPRIKWNPESAPLQPPRVPFSV